MPSETIHIHVFIGYVSYDIREYIDFVRLMGVATSISEGTFKCSKRIMVGKLYNLVAIYSKRGI